MVRQAHHERPLTLSLSKGAGFAFPVGLAIVFLVLHLPYLPASLEDLDSVNFALGVRDFDVAHHQPHPPGYPVFILLAKTARVVPSLIPALPVASRIPVGRTRE